MSLESLESTGTKRMSPNFLNVKDFPSKTPPPPPPQILRYNLVFFKNCESWVLSGVPTKAHKNRLFTLIILVFSTK